MAWELVTKTEVNAICLKLLKKLVDDVEKGKKNLIQLTEEDELKDTWGEGYVRDHNYTGKDTIIIRTERVMEKADESS